MEAMGPIRDNQFSMLIRMGFSTSLRQESTPMDPSLDARLSPTRLPYLRPDSHNTDSTMYSPAESKGLRGISKNSSAISEQQHVSYA